MFNDDGLGEAMARSNLEGRIKALERKVDRLLDSPEVIAQKDAAEAVERVRQQEALQELMQRPIPGGYPRYPWSRNER